MKSLSIIGMVFIFLSLALFFNHRTAMARIESNTEFISRIDSLSTRLDTKLVPIISKVDSLEKRVDEVEFIIREVE